jgi:hypothetical protein
VGELVAAAPPPRIRPRRGRIILGRRDRLRDRLLGRLYLAVEQCHSVLAFGSPGSFMAVDDLAPVEVLRPTDDGEAAA